MSVVVGVSVVLSFISLIYLVRKKKGSLDWVPCTLQRYCSGLPSECCAAHWHWFWACEEWLICINPFLQCTYVRPGPKRSTVGLELAACVFGLIWWIPAAVTATVYGRRADSDGLVEEPARTAVWALSWSSLGLFTLASLLSLLRWLEHRQRGRRPAVVQLQPPPHFTSSAGPPSYEYSPGGYPTPMQPAPGAPPLNGQTYGCPQSQQYPAAAEPPSYCPNYAR